MVKTCANKSNGDSFAAKMVKYDEDTIEVTKKEFELWKTLRHPSLVFLHDAYLVRKYLVLICDLIQGETVLDYLSRLDKLTEDDVACCVRQLLVALDYLHTNDICHLDVRVSHWIYASLKISLSCTPIFSMANFLIRTFYAHTVKHFYRGHA